jgi:PAS domain S-box-containing protein
MFANLQAAYAELAQAQFELQRRASEVEEARDVFHLVIDSMSEALFSLDRAGKIVQVNPAASALLERGAEELLGHQLAEVCGQADLPATPWQVLERSPGGTIPDLEVSLTSRGGQSREVSASCTLVRDRRGTIIGMLVVMRDVTERRRAEEAQRFLEEASRLLFASLDYEATLQRVAHLIVPRLADWCVVDILQEDGSVRRLVVVHGGPMRELLAGELAERYHADPARNFGVARVLRTGEPDLLPSVSEEHLLSHAHDARHLELLRDLGFASRMIVPLRARGRTLGALSFVASTSARGYSERDLPMAVELGYRAGLAVDNARLYREAQAAIRVRDEFLSVAAHELKTPLTALRASAQLILRLLQRQGSVDMERLSRGLQTIDSQSDRLARLTNQLFDLSRLERGKLVLERQRVDLAELVQASVTPMQALATGHWFLVQAPGPTWAHVDPLRLGQVLSNLLDNAVKFSPQGGPIEVDLSCPSPAEVRIAVRDHGLGIPPDQRDHIFDRFYQAHAAEHRSGIGLGLYVSRELVDLHGGRLEAEFPPDGGSRFVVTLPTGIDLGAGDG